MSWSRPTGVPSCHGAIRKGTSTSSTSRLIEACQPTIFWEKQSTMNAT